MTGVSTKLENNLWVNQYGSSAPAALDLVHNPAVAEVVVKNNTMVDFDTGIRADDAIGYPLEVRNNIIDATTTLDLPTGSMANVHHNLLTDCLITTDGNICGDPEFVDAVNGDYHLDSTSPAIDAGDPLDDYSNEPMPNGSVINMGAYGNTLEATTSP